MSSRLLSLTRLRSTIVSFRAMNFNFPAMVWFYYSSSLIPARSVAIEPEGVNLRDIDTSLTFFNNLFDQGEETTEATRKSKFTKEMHKNKKKVESEVVSSNKQKRVIATEMAITMNGVTYEGKKEGDVHFLCDTNAKLNGEYKVVYPIGSVFEGTFKDGMYHGTGHRIVMVRDIGPSSTNGTNNSATTTSARSVYSTYTGKFFQGQRNGKGTMTYNNGTVYKGEWDHDKPHGKGTMTYSDGSVYKGMWHYDKPHGKGMLTCAEGSVQGEFKEGRIYNGSGILRRSDEICEGTWVDGMMSGAGKSTDTRGNVYNGEFLHNYPHGKGIIRYSTGDVYEGEFVARKRHGFGVLVYANGDRYEGQFVKGKRHGEGKVQSNAHTYQGTFVDGLMYTGSGSVVSKDGSVLEGEWREGILHGKLTSTGGAVVEGEFREGKIYNGTGVCVNKDGSTYQGPWVKGKKHGVGKLVHARSFVEGEFRDDKYHIQLDRPIELTPNTIAACWNPSVNIQSTQVESNIADSGHLGTNNGRKVHSSTAADLFAAGDPTADPSAAPSQAPSSLHPTPVPTPTLTLVPTRAPTLVPTLQPSAVPSTAVPSSAKPCAVPTFLTVNCRTLLLFSLLIFASL